MVYHDDFIIIDDVIIKEFAVLYFQQEFYYNCLVFTSSKIKRWSHCAIIICRPPRFHQYIDICINERWYTVEEALKVDSLGMLRQFIIFNLDILSKLPNGKRTI